MCNLNVLVSIHACICAWFSHFPCQDRLARFALSLLCWGLADAQHTLRSQWLYIFGFIRKLGVQSLRYWRYGMSSNPCSIGITWGRCCRSGVSTCNHFERPLGIQNPFRSALWRIQHPFEKRQVTHMFISSFERRLVTHTYFILTFETIPRLRVIILKQLDLRYFSMRLLKLWET